MRNNLKISLIIIFLTIFSNLHSQITTGALHLKFEDFEMKGMEEQGEEAKAQMGAMFEQMQMSMYFNPEQTVTKMKMMGMMDMTIFLKGKTQIQYMDIMGQKVKIVSESADQLAQLGISQDEIQKLYSTRIDKNDTKDILGFSCNKVTVVMDMSKISNLQGEGQIPEGMNNLTMSFYVTEKIKMNNYNYQQLPGFKMAGVPLEMSFDMGPIKMVMRASGFEEEIDESVFNVPEGDYKEMTLEEMQKMELNPGSFGF